MSDEIKFIRTAGDLRAGVAGLGDEEQIEFWINAAAADAYFLGHGGIGGDAANIQVIPNYTMSATKMAELIMSEFNLSAKQGEPDIGKDQLIYLLTQAGLPKDS